VVQVTGSSLFPIFGPAYADDNGHCLSTLPEIGCVLF
jgi:hypothetical protein